MSDEQNANPQVHHQTVRGARLAIARKEISKESFEAVLEGRLSLADAKDLGRNRGPDTSEPEEVQEGATEAAPKPSPCWCGCGQRPKSPGSRWVQGHDARAESRILRAARAGEVDGLSPELRAYGVERGLLDG